MVYLETDKTQQKYEGCKELTLQSGNTKFDHFKLAIPFSTS